MRKPTPIQWVAAGAAFVIIFIIVIAALSQAVPQTRTTNLVNGLITVQPGGWNYYYFTIPSGASGAHVEGSFLASGGSGNDIYVYIMDQTNYINWANGHQATAYYNSGKLTTDNFDVNLPSTGGYYLVYDNTFSTYSSKNVDTTVNLIYIQ